MVAVISHAGIMMTISHLKMVSYSSNKVSDYVGLCRTLQYINNCVINELEIGPNVIERLNTQLTSLPNDISKTVQRLLYV